VLHFPIRSLQQSTDKYLRWWDVAPSEFRGLVYDAHREGRMSRFYESFVVGDGALAKGVARGTLAVDTRLRDALRLLRAERRHGLRTFELPPRAKCLTFADGAVDADYLSELGTLEDADPRVLAQHKADDFEVRLAALEQRHSTRILSAVSERALRGVHRS
jgi:hypothetical protein